VTQLCKKEGTETNTPIKNGGTKTKEIKTNDLRQITLNNEIDYIRQLLTNLGVTSATPKD
jgi:hypothetical protein